VTRKKGEMLRLARRSMMAKKREQEPGVIEMLWGLITGTLMALYSNRRVNEEQSLVPSLRKRCRDPRPDNRSQ